MKNKPTPDVQEADIKSQIARVEDALHDRFGKQTGRVPVGELSRHTWLERGADGVLRRSIEHPHDDNASVHVLRTLDVEDQIVVLDALPALIKKLDQTDKERRERFRSTYDLTEEVLQALGVSAPPK